MAIAYYHKKLQDMEVIKSSQFYVPTCSFFTDPVTYRDSQ